MKGKKFPRKEVFLRSLDNANNKGIATTITTLAGQRPTDNFIIDDTNKEINLKRQLCNKLIENNMVEEMDVIRHSYSNSRMNKFYSSNKENKDCSPTLDTRCDCLGVVVNDKINVIGNYKPSGHSCGRIITINGISPTIMENHGAVQVIYNNLRIRKLTPKECFRLMGVKDQDFNLIAQNQSNASLYHLAGDSIVVDVLMAIFKQML